MNTNRWDFERAVTASNLPAPSRLVLLVLAIRADATTGTIPAEFSPSHAQLAADTGLSRRAIVTHLAAVEADGWLRVKRAPIAQQRAEHTPNQYRLALPKTTEKLVQDVHPEPPKASAPAAPPPTRASAPRAPRLVQEVHQASAGGAHNQTTTNQLHNQAPSGATRTSAGARTRATLEHLNATAVTRPDSMTLVSTWARTLKAPIRLPVQRELAREIDRLRDDLRADVDPTLLQAALNLWAAKGRRPAFLPHCYDDAAQSARAATTPDVPGSRVHQPARPSTTDQRVAAVQALREQWRADGRLDDDASHDRHLRALPGAAS